MTGYGRPSAAWAPPSSERDRRPAALFRRNIAASGRTGYRSPKMLVSFTGQRRPIAMITRRQFVMSSSAALALGALGSVGAFEFFSKRGGRAEAQTFSVLELEAKGPLDDIPMGSENAPVTIIEYASMTCPHCAAFANLTFPKLKEKYIDTGKVKYIMREYP